MQMGRQAETVEFTYLICSTISVLNGTESNVHWILSSQPFSEQVVS